MLDLDMERMALSEVIRTQDHSMYVSADQVGGLIGLVNQGLKDKRRANRIAVMRFLVGDAIQDSLGVDFESFKNMSSAIATVMINQFLVPDSKPWRLNQYGRELISYAEDRVKAQSGYFSV